MNPPVPNLAFGSLVMMVLHGSLEALTCFEITGRATRLGYQVSYKVIRNRLTDLSERKLIWAPARGRWTLNPRGHDFLVANVLTNLSARQISAFRM
jgi:repressor of nif and glnA expression